MSPRRSPVRAARVAGLGLSLVLVGCPRGSSPPEGFAAPEPADAATAETGDAGDEDEAMEWFDKAQSGATIPRTSDSIAPVCGFTRWWVLNPPYRAYISPVLPTVISPFMATPLRSRPANNELSSLAILLAATSLPG